jgi:hypothetical protein
MKWARWSPVPPATGSLAPFAARARRRRLWRALRWPLLFSGGALLVILVVLTVDGLLFW